MKDMEEGKKDGAIKARVSVVLKANEVVVAEVEDATLWTAVLAAINSGLSALGPAIPAVTAAPAVPLPSQALVGEGSVVDAVVRNTPVTEPINKFAKELGVDLDALAGACDPTPADPYLRLDVHHWEKMKKDLPARGPKAIPPIVLSATILCLWARHAGVGTVTQSQAQNVLAAINCRDNNPSRGIQGATWLQARPGGQIVLNPSQISKAICVAAAFCKQDWSAWKAL
jgi:hypothetical protein